MTPYQLWGWILLAWSLYRYFFRLPEWVDEFVSKPLVFVAPVIIYVFKVEGRGLASIGITTKNFFKALYVGLGFGVIFAIEGIASNIIKYGELKINPIQAFDDYGFFLIIISIATAYSEELLSRGFIFSRIMEKTKNLPYSSTISTILFVLLHIPILVLSHKFQGLTLILFLATDIVLGMANSIVFYYTGSLLAPILVHTFWNMTVALYL